MGILFLIIFVISAILLVLVVMVQDEQGEGVGGIFGGGSSTAFGSRSGNILTRITAICAGVFLVSALILTYINRTPSEATLAAKARLKQLQQNTTEWKYQEKPQSENAGPQAGDQSATGTQAATGTENSQATTNSQTQTSQTGVQVQTKDQAQTQTQAQGQTNQAGQTQQNQTQNQAKPKP